MGYSVREQVWWVMAIVITFILLGFNGEISEGCLKEEREALLKLKEAFNYPNDHSLPSWNNLTLSDCCTWEAVVCDNTTHRVISLLLDNKRDYELRDIKWSLNASSFLPFPQLQVLDLSGNCLSGLFGEIRLDNLQHLNLENNQLTEFPSFDLFHSHNLERLEVGLNFLEGSFPEIISSLTSLKLLSLYYNNLHDSLPQKGGLCNLKNLVSLSLNHNKFEGPIPACLSNLTSLRVLRLNENRFEGTFPSLILHTLKSLEVIALSDDYFNGTSFSLSLLAKHSNLKIFTIICSNANLIKLETESPPFIPSFQLRIFGIRNCTLNEANNNKMPSFLLHQYDLLFLHLSRLNISGTFPSWLLANNTGLNHFNVTQNLFVGPFELNSTTKFLQMESFDISSNPIMDVIPSHIGFIFPNLISLNMTSSSLRGCFPASMGEMRQLNDIDLSNNKLSGYLPEEFGQGKNELRFLKLSNNNLSGPCLPMRSNFTKLLFMDLSNNNFKGNFSMAGIIHSTKLRLLDVSANQLFGEIPSWIGNFQHLSHLILSNNSFKGSLPKSFCNLTELTYLDLSQNEFSGSLPNCMNMPLLQYLHLQSNCFTGPFPYTLTNSPLLTLDLMKNHFSGQVLRLLGSFSNLRVLILKENKLEGSIPHDLCKLKKISLLDLSHNKFSGRIPYCLNNITFGQIDASRMIRIGTFAVSWTTRASQYSFNPFNGEVGILEVRQDITLYRDQKVDFTTKRRYESYEGNILNFMSGLDLSENQLTGEIPSQIGFLNTIHALNLSNNHLKGPIPETFSRLKEIESLDLSHNKLTGHIPAQLTQLYSLSVFSVAHNNLSGVTPDMKNQFATFGSTSYEGNHFLCGPPLQQNCSYIAGRDNQFDHLEADDFRSAFLWTFGGAFGVFFLGVIIVIHFNPYDFSYKLHALERAVVNFLYE